MNVFDEREQRMKLKLKTKRLILAIIGCLLITSVFGFLIWTQFYYHADSSVITLRKNDLTIESKDNLTIVPEKDSTVGIIFYPGAKVESISYLPVLKKIRDTANVTCILVKMPLNLAIFDGNAADEVIKKYPKIKTWYMAGHSLGGYIACEYAYNHQDTIQGTILMGAYPYKDYPTSKLLTIYGTLNTSVADKITYTENVVKIVGGNHAQFGNYGKQKGDPDATITADDQQNITAKAVADFITANTQ